MARASIPVDLRNPGQVFACLGFMEATEILCGPCEGAFVYTASETLTHFTMDTGGATNPFEATLRFLGSASVEAVAPSTSDISAAEKKWGVATHGSASTSYPFAPPESPATWAAMLVDDRGTRIAIEHWGDSSKMGRDNLKFWAGAGGYPGAALARDALVLLERLGPKPLTQAAKDPFAVQIPQSSSFRFDWRRDYVPLDVGFSPNEHGNIVMVGFPLVELLAAIGLQHARPERPERKDKLTYRYGVSNATLPTSFVRAVLGAQGMNFPMRTFRMRLGWPGQEGQARCIIDTREEAAT
jgi:CRISPR-associated protein Csx14